MAFLDLDGIPYLVAVAAFILGVSAIGGLLAITAAPHLARPFDVLTPQATALAHDPTDI